MINKTKPANCIGLKVSSEPSGRIDHGIKKKAHTKTVLTVSTILVHHVSTSEMVKNLTQIFRELDTDGNGTLS